MEKKPFETGPYSRYKKRFLIAFYDEKGENFIEVFANVREILVYQGKEITRQNVNYLNIHLYRALNWYDHRTSILNGKKMTVWLVEDDEIDKRNMKGDKQCNMCESNPK